jgi:hypothetical protein
MRPKQSNSTNSLSVGSWPTSITEAPSSSARLSCMAWALPSPMMAQFSTEQLKA